MSRQDRHFSIRYRTRRSRGGTRRRPEVARDALVDVAVREHQRLLRHVRRVQIIYNSEMS